MEVRSLDDIVLDEKIKQRIRPYFEKALAAGELGFEHDWQWKAYCDILTAIIKYKEELDASKEKINRYVIDYSSKQSPETILEMASIARTQIRTKLCLVDVESITNNLIRQIPELTRRITRYTPLIDIVYAKGLCSSSIQLHSLEVTLNETEKRIKKRMGQWVQIVNEGDEELLLCLQNFLPSLLDYYSSGDDVCIALSKIRTNSSEERTKIRQFLEVPCLGKYNYSMPLSLLARPEYTFRVGEVARIDEAIECASLPQIGNYQPIAVLGKGGFKTTYLAWDEVLEERVALKVMHASDGPSVRAGLYKLAEARGYTGDARKQEALARAFKDESQALRRITHDHIARFLGAGLNPVMYLAEEYIEGQTLEDITLSAKTQYQRFVLVQSLFQVAKALQYLHRNRIVHLDVKPANILIHPEIGAVLTDFGSCQVLPASGEAQLIKPTSRIYQAPEIMREDPITHATDYWMFGVTAYMVLTGHHPYCPELTLQLWHDLDPKDPRKDELADKFRRNIEDPEFKVSSLFELCDKQGLYAPSLLRIQNCLEIDCIRRTEVILDLADYNLHGDIRTK